MSLAATLLHELLTALEADPSLAERARRLRVAPEPDGCLDAERALRLHQRVAALRAHIDRELGDLALELLRVGDLLDDRHRRR